MKRIFTLLLFILSGSTGFSQSWETLNTGLGSNIKIHSVVFTQQSNYQTGYAVGGDNYTSGVVIKSEDWGDTWTNLGTIASEELYSVCFPSTDTGYTVSMLGKVYKTSDAGATWQLIFTIPGGQGYAISFKDIYTGVVGAPGKIYYTYNGGQAWNLGAGTSNTNSQDITYCEGDTYMAAGYTETNLTTNKGHDWTTIVSNASDLLLGTGSLGAQYMATCGDYGKIHVTKNGGTSWNTVKKGDNLFHDVAYWDTNYIYVVGTPGLVYKSSDGGTTFASDGSLGSGAVFCVFITPSFTIYTCGSQGMMWRKQEVYPYPYILVSPSTVDFDTITVGTTAQRTLTITNSGGDDLVVTDITTSMPQFSVYPKSFTLAPGAYKDVTITFSPIDQGQYLSSLTIVSNAHGQNAPVQLVAHADWATGFSNRGAALFNCYPSPFTSTFSMDMNLPNGQQVRFELLNSSGTLISSASIDCQAGYGHFESSGLWPGSSELTAGIYYVRVVSEKTSTVKRIVKIR